VADDPATDDLVLRPATSADVTALTQIYAHNVLHGTGTFEVEPPVEDDMAARLEAVVSAGLPYLVAVDGRGVLGFAYAAPYRPRPAYRFTVEDSIYLSPAASGRGVGTRLLTDLVKRCEQLDIREVIAVIGDSDNTASIRIHDKCGFERIGTFRNVGWKHGRWLDTVLMQRSLSPSAMA
jgi:phosphinothricin acetyltransferase